MDGRRRTNENRRMTRDRRHFTLLSFWWPNDVAWSLKGSHKSAQGNALGIEGRIRFTSPERAQQPASQQQVVSPFQGLGQFAMLVSQGVALVVLHMWNPALVKYDVWERMAMS